MPLDDQQKEEFALIIKRKIEESDEKTINVSAEESKKALEKLLQEEDFTAIREIEFSNPIGQSFNIRGQGYLLTKGSKLNLLQYAVLYVQNIEIFAELINKLQAKFNGQDDALKQFYEQTLLCSERNPQNDFKAALCAVSVYDLVEARLVQDFPSQGGKSGSEVKTALKDHLKALRLESFTTLEGKREEGAEAVPIAESLSREDLQKLVTNLEAQLLAKEEKIKKLTQDNAFLETERERTQTGWDNSKTASDGYKKSSDDAKSEIEALLIRNRELEQQVQAQVEEAQVQAALRISEVEGQAQSLREQLAVLTESQPQLNAENEALKAARATSGAKIAELEKQLKEMQESAQLRQATPLGALPSNDDKILSQNQQQEDNKYAKSLEARVKALKYTMVTIVLAAIGGTVILSMVPKFVKNNETLDIIAKIGVGSIGVGIVALMTYLLSPSEEKINTKMDESSVKANNGPKLKI